MPPIQMPTYEETPSTLNTPRHAIQATHVFAYTPPPRYIRRTDTNMHHDHICQFVCCIRSRGTGLDLSYDAGAACGRHEAGRQYVCCSCGVVRDVEGGGGLIVRRHSYRGNAPELWRISDGLKNDKKQLKVKQSRQTRVFLGFFRPKISTTRFGPMTGLVGYVFDLIFCCTCFWPRTDQVYLCLAIFCIM